MPASIDVQLRKLDPLRFVVAVQNEEQAIDASVGAVLACVELHTHGPSIDILPSRGPEVARVPRQIGDTVGVEILTEVELPALQDRKAAGQCDGFPKKLREILVTLG